MVVFSVGNGKNRVEITSMKTKNDLSGISLTTNNCFPKN